MIPWKTHKRKLVYDQSPWVVIEHHEVELPSGRIIPDWPWIVTPDYVNILVQTEKGDFLCFRQTKFGLSRPTLAIIGGYCMPGEDPSTAARRELREETGYEAPDWIELGHYLVDPNRGIATGHLYLARRARWVTQPVTDDLEEQQLLRLSRDELEGALDRGEFKVLAWAAIAALALRRL